MFMMEPKQIFQRWTVSEILQRYPGTFRVFFEKKTSCVGCSLARFCTLTYVAQVYGLEIEPLLRELQQAAINEPINP